MAFMKERLYEASTYRGVVYIAAACLIKVFPDQKENIIVGALGLSGAIGMFLRDSLKPLIPIIPSSLDAIKDTAVVATDDKQ